MKSLRILALSTFASVAVLAFANGQTATTTPTATVTQAVVTLQTTEAAKMATAPNPVTATFTDLIEPAGKTDAGPITAHGFVRQVTQNGVTINQISWTSVSATVKGSKRVSGISDPLTSQFQLQSDTLPKDSKINAAGDKDLLNAAIRALFDTEEEPAAKEEKKTEQEKTTPTAQSQKSNDVASGYQTPQLIASDDTAEAAALPVAFGATTEGCQPRVDLAAGMVYMQSAPTKSEGGAVTTTGECSDTSITFPIKKSYARCPSDDIDQEAGKAYPQYISYWTDGTGSNHDLADCTPDNDQFFAIETTKDGCTIAVDLTNDVAKPRTRQVYTNGSNTLVQVTSCQPADDEAYPITWTTAGCSVRHDFTAGLSTVLHRAVYMADGEEKTALGCSDSTTTYAHEAVRYLDGAAVCAWLEDPTTKTAYPQERKRIVTDTGPQYITECAPITAAGSPFQVSAAGCEFTFFHDTDAGQSFGSQKTYYEAEGAKVYLTDCQQSEKTYEHQREGGAVNGWLYNDPQKTAKEKISLYINTEWGRREVAPTYVPTDAPAVPYVYVKTGNTQTGMSIYEGCSGWYETALTEEYTRPDNSKYYLQIGAGTPAGPRNVCQLNTVATRNIDRTFRCFITTREVCNSDGDCYQDQTRNYRVGTYSAGHYQQVNFETQDVVTDYHAWIALATERDIGGNVSTSYWSFNGYPQSCPFNHDFLPNVPTGW